MRVISLPNRLAEAHSAVHKSGQALSMQLYLISLSHLLGAHGKCWQCAFGLNLEVSFAIANSEEHVDTTRLQVQHSQLTSSICRSFCLLCNSSHCHTGSLIPVLLNILGIPGQDDPTADQISGLQRPLLRRLQLLWVLHSS